MDPASLFAASALGAFLFLWLIVFVLAVAVIVLSIVVVVQAYKAGREGWWVYLIAVFIGPLNIVSIIAWFAYLRNNPVMSNGKPFL